MHSTKQLYFMVIISVLLITNSMVLAQLGGPKELRKITSEPAEIISISSSLPFEEAMEVFNDLSKRYLNKIIIYPSDLKGPIGINIDKIHWLDAFELVMREKELLYDEYREHIIIKRDEDTGPSEEFLTAQQLFQTREVKISAIFFEANNSMLRELGSSMNLLSFGKDSTHGITFSSSDGNTSLMQLADLDNLSFRNLTAIFKTLQSNQLGEIIASPQVTVRSEKEGMIQIGTDFSVTTQDFSGNTITQMFSTGTIIKVEPQVITVDSATFIHVTLSAERSSGSETERGLQIDKTEATTSVLLLDGEETMIGGLYTNEEGVIRSGIPILKDLPWWFLGLRYIFGFHSKNIIQKELIILLRADLLPSLSERIISRKNEFDESRLLEESLKDLREQKKKIIDQK
ncbi:MAG: hypothetical protein P9L92_20835 [Candidatus Electryonea clarkiae]|nr:hypothetical protein [Candidatus Electryonea clarkiae]MDP8288521.1 hypothetical protein [Candidatus Electryonea clarkiae]